MSKYILFLSIFLTFMSCNKNEDESLLAIVIKLNSAESLGNFNEATKYIDIDKVYSKYVKDGKSANEIWREYVMFTYNLSQDNKFTNTFKYYQYSIRENQNGNTGVVTFESINPKAKIKKLIYKLTRIGNNWKVTDIEYIK